MILELFLNNAEFYIKEVGGSAQCSELPSACCWLVLKSTNATCSAGSAFNCLAGCAALHRAEPWPKPAGRVVVNTSHGKCLFESFHLSLKMHHSLAQEV